MDTSLTYEPDPEDKTREMNTTLFDRSRITAPSLPKYQTSGIPYGRNLRRKQHILIVDDDPNLRMLLEYVLRKKYQVSTREDGLSAMAYLAGGHLPDLIIADLDMPRLNGYEFLQQLSISGYFSSIPTLILSGFDQEDLKSQCIETGAAAYLQKPFNPEQIMATLDKLLPSATALSS